MKNRDLIQRFLFESLSIRGEWACLQESYQTIIKQHHYPKVIEKILGEILVVATLLRAVLKFEGRLSVQFQGKDKLKLLFAEVDHEFHVRAYAQFSETVLEDEMLSQLKNGLMVITMDPKEGNRYQGIVNWQGNSIAESIEGYFKNSEQVDTRLWLAVNQEEAVGMLLQVLPEEENKEVAENFHHLSQLTNTITDQELFTLDLQTILHRLYSEEDVTLFKPHDVSFRCRCSEERSENALLILGREEVEQELLNNNEIVVMCEFCGKEYTYDREAIARIFTMH